MYLARLFITCLLLCLMAGANARMYQWVDPENGTTQLSGKPPVWYRSLEGGPRVFVFENGRIIDDTGVEVSETERDHLRQQALLKAMEDREAARDSLLEARRMRAILDQNREPEPETLVIEEPVMDTETEEDTETAATEEEAIEQMRALIQEWEEQRTESARQVINPASR